MKDLNQIINGLSSSGALSGLAGGLAGGTLVSALSSKKGRKLGSSALKVGALAAVGGVAWKAYQNYSQKNDRPTPTPKAFDQLAVNRPLDIFPQPIAKQQFDAVIENTSSNAGQMLLLRAMIAAAYADGHIDYDEQQRIFARVDQLELNAEDKASLLDELRHPLSYYHLVKQVPSREAAIEVYAASLLAIDESRAESVNYLSQLAGALNLPGDLIASVHNEVAAASADSNKAFVA